MFLLCCYEQNLLNYNADSITAKFRKVHSQTYSHQPTSGRNFVPVSNSRINCTDTQLLDSLLPASYLCGCYQSKHSVNSYYLF